MNQSRIKIPLTMLDNVLEILSLLVTLSVLALFIGFWIDAPEIIPVHFNLQGEVDRFGNKTEVIVLLLIHISMYVGMTILNRFPHIFNYPTVVTEQNRFALYKLAQRMVRWVKLFSCLMFANILWQIKYGYGLGGVFILSMCLTFCMIFYIVKMSKIEKNEKQEIPNS